MKRIYKQIISVSLAFMMILTLVLVPDINVFASEDTEVGESTVATEEGEYNVSQYNDTFKYPEDLEKYTSSFEKENYSLPEDGHYYYAEKREYSADKNGGDYQEIFIAKEFYRVCFLPVFRDESGSLDISNTNPNFLGYGFYGKESMSNTGCLLFNLFGGLRGSYMGTSLNSGSVSRSCFDYVNNKPDTSSSYYYGAMNYARPYLYNTIKRVNDGGIKYHYEMDTKCKTVAVDSNIPIFHTLEDANKFISGEIGIEDSDNYDKLQGLKDGQFIDDDGYLVDSTVPTFEQITCSLNKNYADVKNYSVDFRYDLPSDCNANDGNYKIIYKYNYNVAVSPITNPTATTKSFFTDTYSREDEVINSSNFTKHSYKPYPLYNWLQSTSYIGTGFLLMTYGELPQITLTGSCIVAGVSLNLDDIIKLKNSNINVEVLLARKNEDGQWTYGKSSNFSIDTMNGQVSSFVSQNTKEGSQLIDGSQGGTTIYNNNTVTGGGAGSGGSNSSSSGWDKLLDMIDNLFTTLTTLVVKILQFVIDTLNGILDDLLKLVTTLVDGLTSLVQNLLSGFGLFAENGLIQLFNSMFPSVPAEIWALLEIGIAISIFAALYKIFRG